MKRFDALHWSLFVVIGVLLGAFFVTPYRYEHWANGQIVRIHRATGDAERLTAGGWIEMKPKVPRYVLDKEH